MDIKLHYLELFYHVARHGGQSAASRNMGYGIQPCTISRQICELERVTGLSLYVREPFKLTAAGEKLFDFIKPLFDELPRLIQRLGQDVPELVRLGASAVVLRDYLPSVLPVVQRNFPQLRLTFNEGLQSQINRLLKENLIDLAVTLLHGTLPKGYLCEELLRLPLILLVPRTSRLRSATELWRQKPVAFRLISPGPDDAIHKYFTEGLEKRGVEWPTVIEVNAIGIVESCVKRGIGVGISVGLPGRALPAGLRALPLPDFPRVPVGMIWRSNPSPATEALMREFRREASQFTKVNRIAA